MNTPTPDCREEWQLDTADKRLIKQLGSLILVEGGGTFENDPPDAIIDAAIRLIAPAAEAHNARPIAVDDGMVAAAIKFPEYNCPKHGNVTTAIMTMTVWDEVVGRYCALCLNDKLKECGVNEVTEI